MSRFMSARLAALDAYVPGEQPRDKSYIKLNTNESPYPPSPAVAEAFSREAIDDLRLYGGPRQELTEALAAYYGVSPENVFLGNGSDEVLSFVFMAFGEKGVSYPDISYGFYSVYAGLYNLNAREVPLKENFTLDPEDYCVDNSTAIIANPNAPTGLAIPASAVEDMLKRRPDRLLVVDEAYVDFGGESCVELTKKYENLLIVQTFSKSRSFAGGRLGVAVGNSALISDLEKIRFCINPYNVNRITLLAGIAALESQDYYDARVRDIISTRDKFAGELRKIGFELEDSKTNFLFAKPPKVSAHNMYLALKERGILVRHFSKPRIENYLRITIGTPEQMDTLLNCMKEILENA